MDIFPEQVTPASVLAAAQVMTEQQAADFLAAIGGGGGGGILVVQSYDNLPSAGEVDDGTLALVTMGGNEGERSDFYLAVTAMWAPVSTSATFTANLLRTIITDPGLVKAALDSDGYPEAALYEMWREYGWEANTGYGGIFAFESANYPSILRLPQGCPIFSNMYCVFPSGLPLPGRNTTSYSNTASCPDVPASEVDAVLVALDSYGKSNGQIDLTGCVAPTATGLAAKASLEGKGWTVAVAVNTPESNGFTLIPADGTPVDLTGSLWACRLNPGTLEPDAAGTVLGRGESAVGPWLSNDLPYPPTALWTDVDSGTMYLATTFDGSVYGQA